MRLKKGRLLTLFVIGVPAALAIWLWPYLGKIPAAIQIYCSPKRSFHAESSEQTLKVLGQAMKTYMEAEGAYPPAERWMDALAVYLHTDDMKPEEQAKKLKRPEFEDSADEYGFAYNGTVAGKTADQLEDLASTPLLYDSEKTKRNAYDDTPLESALPNGAVLYADGSVSRPPKNR
ncbi:MAG: hypothetical protein AKCLJLPJ_00457 [Fimbriimonadales bacterium]|nr:MAG: hypothetical protein EDM73_03615 [Armatimonadota bacterium]MBV6502413.1 hypothetical protein [Fimbriimonadales bacterium]MCE7898745.1 hypothetical protein [Armatimonadetes bacterium ATM1]MDL1928758.1 hypothetical protein [Fimbriimonadia bacterium ATM]MBC6968417.1 hypothetical protein [Armatimonadota bacterium]